MEIVFDPNRLEQTTSGSIIGQVFYQFWAVQFPGDGWDDFVVVLANWWLVALGELRNSSKATTRFQFMDGPYWINAQRANGIVVLECIEDRPSGGVMHNEMMPLPDFEAVVLKFARQVLNAVDRCRMNSTDVEELRRRLNG